MSKCGCAVDCPLHAAAEELLRACEYALTAIVKFDEFPQVLKTSGQLIFARELKASLRGAIAKAGGQHDS